MTNKISNALFVHDYIFPYKGNWRLYWVIQRYFRTSISGLTLHKFFNIVLAFLEMMTGRTQLHSKPAVLRVEVTNLCNLKCPRCSCGTDSDPRKKGFMNLENYIGVLKDNRRNALIVRLDVPQSEVYSFFNLADLFLNSLAGKSVPKCYHNHLSAKMCEYLMAGKPVISIENGPVCGEILTEIGAGFSVPAHNPKALVERIVYFADNRNETINCGNRAKKYAVTNLDRQVIAEKFFNELVLKFELR